MWKIKKFSRNHNVHIFYSSDNNMIFHCVSCIIFILYLSIYRTKKNLFIPVISTENQSVNLLHSVQGFI